MDILEDFPIFLFERHFEHELVVPELLRQALPVLHDHVEIGSFLENVFAFFRIVPEPGFEEYLLELLEPFSFAFDVKDTPRGSGSVERVP